VEGIEGEFSVRPSFSRKGVLKFQNSTCHGHLEKDGCSNQGRNQKKEEDALPPDFASTDQNGDIKTQERKKKYFGGGDSKEVLERPDRNHPARRADYPAVEYASFSPHRRPAIRHRSKSPARGISAGFYLCPQGSKNDVKKTLLTR